MKATPSPHTVALLGAFILLGLAVLLARARDGADDPPARHPFAVDFCLLVRVGDAPSRLVCAPHRSLVLGEAASRLPLPSSCAGLSLPDEVGTCDTIQVRQDEEGRCVAGAVPRESEALRLLCGGTIDVNRATEEELTLLPGIGPSRAASIARSREEEGPFRNVDDLTRVRGIGEKTARAMLRWVEF